jgi:hypothetical protein
VSGGLPFACRAAWPWRARPPSSTLPPHGLPFWYTVHELRQWDVVRVAPDVLRAFESGDAGMEVIVAGGPVPEGQDGEMVQITWRD